MATMNNKQMSVYTQVVNAVAEHDGVSPFVVIADFSRQKFVPTTMAEVTLMGKAYTVVTGIGKSDGSEEPCGFVLELQGDKSDTELEKALVDMVMIKEAPQVVGQLTKMSSNKGQIDGSLIIPAIRSGVFGSERSMVRCADGQEISCVALTNKEARRCPFAEGDAMNKMKQLKSNSDARHRLRMKYEAKRAAATK